MLYIIFPYIEPIEKESKTRIHPTTPEIMKIKTLLFEQVGLVDPMMNKKDKIYLNLIPHLIHTSNSIRFLWSQPHFQLNVGNNTVINNYCRKNQMITHFIISLHDLQDVSQFYLRFMSFPIYLTLTTNVLSQI